VLLLLLGWYAYLCYHFPAGSGAGGPNVAREPFQRPWTRRKVLLLGIGDSVTSGFGAVKGHSYFARLAQNPPDEFDEMRGVCLSAVIPRLSVRNLAVPGSNSIAHLQKQIQSLETQQADVLGVVVMTTGGNDIIHSYGRQPPCEGAMYSATLEQAQPWIASFAARLNSMIDELERRLPGGCEVFLADIYDPTDGKGVPWIAPYPAWGDQEEILRQYNDAIHGLCRRRTNVHLVPVHDAFLGHGLCCSRFWEGCYRGDDPTAWYAANIEDPTERGYDAIRRLFLLEMAKVLPRPE
jgi:lysophospholipase L1-like esterase